MRDRRAAALALVVLLMLGRGVRGESALTEEDATVRGNTAFAAALYRKLAQAEGNLFFSPHSISTALAMTWGGARGRTADQMAEVLHFGGGDAHAGFERLAGQIEKAKSKGEIEIAIANSIWPQEGYAFLPEYVALLKKRYGVTVTPVDYGTAAEAARAKINAWVAEKTRENIQNLIPRGVLTPLVRLVLVNAIYFKGDWAEQFEKKATHPAPFVLGGGRTAKVQMMHRKGQYGYMEDDSAQVLELPYAGGALSMVVVLPREADGLAKLEAGLTAERLQMWAGRMGRREVRVFMPRFKLETSFRLDEALKEMGMPDAFDDQKADFSGMDGRKWLYIGAVLHKAFVEVNEEGTEAAAATAVIMMGRAAVREMVFRADHPFLFLIRHNASGSVLFLGRVSDPSK
jgi:serpin B